VVTAIQIGSGADQPVPSDHCVASENCRPHATLSVHGNVTENRVPSSNVTWTVVDGTSAAAPHDSWEVVVSTKSARSPTPIDLAPTASTGKIPPGAPSATNWPSGATALTLIRLGMAHGADDTFVSENTDAACCPAPS